jgi:hypothetical protein
MVSFVVGFVLEAQIEGTVAGLISETHVILSLARSFVAVSMFISAVLSTAAARLKETISVGFPVIMFA